MKYAELIDKCRWHEIDGISILTNNAYGLIGVVKPVGNQMQQANVRHENNAKRHPP